MHITKDTLTHPLCIIILLGSFLYSYIFSLYLLLYSFSLYSIYVLLFSRSFLFKLSASFSFGYSRPPPFYDSSLFHISSYSVTLPLPSLTFLSLSHVSLSFSFSALSLSPFPGLWLSCRPHPTNALAALFRLRALGKTEPTTPRQQRPRPI